MASGITEFRDSLKSRLDFDGKSYTYYDLCKVDNLFHSNMARLPYTWRILLESMIRHYDDSSITRQHIEALLADDKKDDQEIPFKPARVLLHDTTGVPAIVDLASLRQAVSRAGGNAHKINPQIPVDLVVDHSVVVDYYGVKESIQLNENLEFERNRERFRFLHWAKKSLDNFRIFPPSTGIMHQINLEYLSSVVSKLQQGDETILIPDSLVGTDSHTTMINGLGVLGYGVGGIEGEAAMLGLPLYSTIPEVVGFELTGELPETATATDLALTITSILRKKDVVGKIVEFHGQGVKHLTVFDRATIANMAPEYGATMGYFPVDDRTLEYLAYIGRSPNEVRLVRHYYKAQHLFYDDKDSKQIDYKDTVSLNLTEVETSLSGPKRPQDRISLGKVQRDYQKLKNKPMEEGGFHLDNAQDEDRTIPANQLVKPGDVVIAAITSCTNTSNPHVLMQAGLIAKKARQFGLQVPKHVKTSLTPGSRVVTDYLRASGLLADLEALGFHIAGYGCATCIGNSGPLDKGIEEAIEQTGLPVASVISGNRNFEGRIHPLVKLNYLASPPLVVAYALAGTIDKDFTQEPIGFDQNDKPIYLMDLWPQKHLVEKYIDTYIKMEMFEERYSNMDQLNPKWDAMDSPDGALYDWDNDSTYIQEAPFIGYAADSVPGEKVEDAHVLALLGDSITTDHISPSGAIRVDSPAGSYLNSKGVPRLEFNSFPSRRGNHLVMERAAFGNARLYNKLAPEKQGGFTKHIPSGKIMSIYEAANLYKDNQTPLIVIAGKEYGTGSSRDWAAKGPALLGVKVVLAESFERIHRSNLVGMGILPLQFTPANTAETLGITGEEMFTFEQVTSRSKPKDICKVQMKRQDGTIVEFDTIIRLDSIIDLKYYFKGGILPHMFDYFMKQEEGSHV
ncbi:aconitate hydratase AcnA [Terribacillus sp. 179-K 1B1 HS]|uniref:aconitate hydratase AcnA n=1 Tax=Terribacillus sp. 179-K 1B1 HS TaxID=3142388 RepID=UPI0039A006B8